MIDSGGINGRYEYLVILKHWIMYIFWNNPIVSQPNVSIQVEKVFK